MPATWLIRQEGEGERFVFAGGGLFTMKASAAETDGALFVVEDVMAHGKTTPLHTHPADECVYVLDGELLVHLDGEEHPVRRGGFAFLPRDVPHALLVTSETARVLAWTVPGEGEAFFRELWEPATSDADALRPADVPRLMAVAERSPHIDVLGPPPFATPATAPATSPS